MGFYYGMYLAVCLLLLLFIRFISFAKSHIDDGKKNHIDLMLLFLLLIIIIPASSFSFPSNDKLSFGYSTFFSSVFLFDFFFFSSLFWYFFYFILFFSFSLLLHVTTTVACYTRWRTMIALFSQLSFVT